jgi:hypothetical protein
LGQKGQKRQNEEKRQGTKETKIQEQKVKKGH